MTSLLHKWLAIIHMHCLFSVKHSNIIDERTWTRFWQIHGQAVDPSISGPQSTSTRLPLLASPLYTQRWGRQSLGFGLQPGCGDGRYRHPRQRVQGLPILPEPSSFNCHEISSWYKSIDFLMTTQGRSASSLNWRTSRTPKGWEVTHWWKKNWV